MTSVQPDLHWLLNYEINVSARYRRFLSLVVVGADCSAWEVDQMMGSTIRSSDVCFPEEQGLSIVMGETGSEEALRAVHRFNRSVNGDVHLHHAIATYPNDGTAPSELIATAARRLIQARTQGDGACVSTG